MAGMMTGISDLAITSEEAQSLAEAVTLVAKEYDVKISGKGAASLNLLITAAVIYGPKAYVIATRGKNGGAIQRAPEPSQASAPAPLATVQPIKWN